MQNKVMNVENQSKAVREILIANMENTLKAISDDYNIDQEIIDNISLSLYVSHTDRVLWKGGKTKFAKIFQKEVDDLMKKDIISFEEFGILTYLAASFTEYEDNIIRVDGEFATKKMITQMLHEKTKNKSRSSIKHYEKVLSDLEKKEVIYSIPNPVNKRSKLFYVSPKLFYKGQYIDKTVMNAIADRIKEVNS